MKKTTIICAIYSLMTTMAAVYHEYTTTSRVSVAENTEDSITDVGASEFKPPATLGLTNDAHSVINLTIITATLEKYISTKEVEDESGLLHCNLSKMEEASKVEEETISVSVFQSKVNLMEDQLPDSVCASVVYTPDVTWVTQDIEPIYPTFHDLVRKVKFKPRFVDQNYNLFIPASTSLTTWHRLPNSYKLPSNAIGPSLGLWAPFTAR